MHETALTSQTSPPAPEPSGRAWLWFGLFAIVAFCAEGLGYAVCLLAGALPPTPLALVLFAAVAAVAGAVAALLMNRIVLDRMRGMASELAGLRGKLAVQQEMEQQWATQTATQAELQRRLRHDLRGALSPALLTADRLISHEDPKVRRAGEIMVKSVDRASTLLADPAEPGGSPQ